ncbi:MAG TPA: acyl carrier protein [Opitutaceae bacterium]|nr:acyl carrier protein [Opitutaceae bacterium]
MPTSSDLPQPLSRFPAEVRAAYQTFRASGDETALRVVVVAAVRDFMPRNSVHSRTEPLRAEERLIEDLGFDSLAVAETVFFFEDLFQVMIKNEEILALRTVGELCDFVARRLRENPPAA